MPAFEYHQFPYLSDNYGVLVHSSETGETACVDAGDCDAALQALRDTGWTLSHILVTHHHGDHTAGLSELKKATQAHVIGPAYESAPIADIDQRVSDGEQFEFAGQSVQVFHTPGHTTDMVNYYLPAESVYFAGDTLFTMGCGKLFEGTPEMMWESLGKVMALPPETTIYCSHEYTLENAEFAITVEPDNTDLQARIARDKALRADNKPTVPSTLAEELATNPFLRPDSPSIRRQLSMESASDLEIFTEVRKRRG